MAVAPADRQAHSRSVKASAAIPEPSGVQRGSAHRRTLLLTLSAAAVITVSVLVAWLATSGRPPVLSPGAPATSSTTSPALTSPPAVTSAPQAISPFTGLPDAGGPVLVVKVDNVRAARPPLGLTAADLVYVEPVEGGLSRLAAVFSSRLPEVVGPVRSARETDLGLLAQFGRPALAYSGAAPELLPQLAAASVVSVSPAQAPRAYFRDPSRAAPHNAFAVTAELLAAAPGASPATDIGLRFGPMPAGGSPTTHEAGGYAAARLSFDWSAADGRWLVSADGVPLVAAEGGRLGAATVVLQSVVVRPSAISDVRGTVSPYAETVGSGSAVVLRDGMRFPARWSRPSPTSGTTFTQADGQSCPFAPGPLWIVLQP